MGKPISDGLSKRQELLRNKKLLDEANSLLENNFIPVYHLYYKSWVKSNHCHDTSFVTNLKRIMLEIIKKLEDMSDIYGKEKFMKKVKIWMGHLQNITLELRFCKLQS